MNSSNGRKPSQRELNRQRFEQWIRQQEQVALERRIREATRSPSSSRLKNGQAPRSRQRPPSNFDALEDWISLDEFDEFNDTDFDAAICQGLRNLWGRLRQAISPTSSRPQLPAARRRIGFRGAQDPEFITSPPLPPPGMRRRIGFRRPGDPEYVPDSFDVYDEFDDFWNEFDAAAPPQRPGQIRRSTRAMVAQPSYGDSAAERYQWIAEAALARLQTAHRAPPPNDLQVRIAIGHLRDQVLPRIGRFLQFGVANPTVRQNLESLQRRIRIAIQ